MVAPKEGERFSFLDPKFEGLLFFESAEIDGRTPSKVFFGKGGLEGGRDFLFDGLEAFCSVAVVFFAEVQLLGL